MSGDGAWIAPARAALARYAFAAASIERIAQGLINLTVRVTATSGERYVLQRLHPVFADSVNDNLERITRHLAQRGLTTPLLVRTRDGARSVTVEGAIWRVLTHVDGRTYDALPGPAQSAAAGHLLGTFHRALADFDQPLAAERPAVHDLARHLATLERARLMHREHVLSDEVARLADAVLARLDAVPAFTQRPLRLVHGDPKISNVMFDPDGHAGCCLIDLDTLARMPLAFELGDAMRSWCNPHAEDAGTAHFDLGLFAAAIAAYFDGAADLPDADERAAVVPATRVICLELAVRFLADALEERYFAWDPLRYARRGAHNLVRARGQLALADSLVAQHDAACAIVADSGRARDSQAAAPGHPSPGGANAR
ncbi:MAG: phosphotransferase [Gammaproteobacteria bacterium]